MDRKPVIAIVMALFLLLASIPSVSGYTGHQLSRTEVLDFTLTDQNNENFTFSQSLSDVHVVAFIFTECIDVCPVITQSLKLVQEGLSDSDAQEVEFLSISVDPRRDTPERLSTFTQLHGVDWPHLTGEAEVLSDVYNSFGIIVQEDVIEAHIANSDPTVTYVDTNGNATELMFEPTGWTTTETIAEEANWSINSSYELNSHVITGINGIESPSDSSWYWSLNTYNESSSAWEESLVGIDEVDALENPNIVWAASNANLSTLPMPSLNDSNPSVDILYPDNSSESHTLQSEFSAYHLTKGAFAGADMNASFSTDPTYGHFLDALDDVHNPSNWSWHWSLYSWNMSGDGWEYSTVGVDDLVDPGYIAWAPNTTDVSKIPMPESLQPNNDPDTEACNGYGWEMGSGAGKHCMCDEGYEWAEGDRLSCVSTGEVEVEFSIGHSTITYIMDGMTPKIAWTGDSWDADDFRADVEQLLSSQSSSSDSNTIPGMTFVVAVTGLTFAALVVHIHSDDEEEEA
tara:strand:- start:4340 stop:5884 length:1545 start_codon:yes stop_codon:yes gene_type:complete